MKKRYVITNSTIKYCMFFLIFTVIYFNNFYTENLNKFIAWMVIIFSCLFAWKCRKNMMLFIVSIFIAYSNYSIAMGIYIIENRPKYLYPQITDIEIYGKGIALVCLFMLLMNIFFPKIYQTYKISSDIFINKEKKNNILIIFLAILFIFLLLYRVILLLGTTSTLYEYGVIFIILMFYYSGKSKGNLFLIYLLSILYIVISFINASRIEAIVCIIILFIFSYSYKVKWYHLILISFVGITLMNIIGIYRSNNLKMSFEQIAYGMHVLWNGKLVFDTCTHAYFPGLCMIEIAKDFSLSDSLYFLKQFILTIFLGKDRVPNGDLIRYTSQFYYHNFGGFSLMFFYVWFRGLGVFVFSYILRWYFEYMQKFIELNKHNGIIKCLIIYIIATVPRWYLYGPLILFRGALIFMIIFYGFSILDKMLKKV